MRYVYACKVKSHPRREVEHSVKENPLIQCEACGKPMYRVIQRPMAINFGRPVDTLISWMEHNYWNWRHKKPKFSPNDVNRPPGEKPLPGKLADVKRGKNG